MLCDLNALKNVLQNMAKTNKNFLKEISKDIVTQAPKDMLFSMVKEEVQPAASKKHKLRHFDVVAAEADSEQHVDKRPRHP